jgi:transposase-like protein
MDARTRLGWIRLYEQLGNAGIVCRRCGISRPTLRKWWRRYQAEGEAGLEARSHRPHRSPGRKVFAEQEALILRLRRERSSASRCSGTSSPAGTGSSWRSTPSTRCWSATARTGSSGRD